MPWGLTATRALLLVAIAVAIAIAITASSAVRQNIKFSERPIGMSAYTQAAQLENEFGRFLADLSRFNSGDERVQKAAIAQHFDRLWATEARLRGDDSVVLRYDENIAVIVRLGERLKQHRLALLDMDRAASDLNDQIIADFSHLTDDLRRLTAEALADHLAKVRSVEILFHGALALAALLTFAFLAEGWNDTHVRRERRRLGRQARAADVARSRFLSMMSHELRTPMNGVLGLLQLLRQSRLSESQERLVDQAERSGRQMTEMLGDILEFSELQAEKLEISTAAYRPQDLAASVQELLAATAVRNHITVTVECARGTPDWIAGDFQRLRQAITHVATNIVEDETVRTFALTLSHDRGKLIAKFRIGNQHRDRSGQRPAARHKFRRPGHYDSAWPDLYDVGQFRSRRTGCQFV